VYASENSRFWCSGLQQLISSISTDSPPHKQQRVLGYQGGQDRRLVGVEAVDAQIGEVELCGGPGSFAAGSSGGDTDGQAQDRAVRQSNSQMPAGGLSPRAPAPLTGCGKFRRRGMRLPGA